MIAGLHLWTPLPGVNSLETGSRVYSSLHLQHQHLECHECMIHTCEEPTDFYTLHRRRGCGGKPGQSCPDCCQAAELSGECPKSVSPAGQRQSVDREDGIPLPHSHPQPAPFRGDSLCPCLARVSPSFERRTFLRQIFKLKSSRTKAACQLGPSLPGAPSPAARAPLLPNGRGV